MATEQKLVKVGDDVVAFPGDLEDAHVAKLVKSFRDKKQQAPNAQYAKSGPYKTELPPEKESQFQSWVKANQVPWQDTPNADYDMRGYWQAMISGDKNARQSKNANDGKMHFPDTWKTPYHKSFSNESKYALPNAPKWNDKDQLVDSTGRVVFDERSAQKAITPKMPIATEASEHARQLKAAQPMSSVLPKVPEWATTPINTQVQKFEEAHPNLYGLDLERQKKQEEIAAQFRAAHPVVGGVVKGANDFAEGMTSPANLALIAAAPESKILSAYFALQALRGSYKDAKSAEEAFRKGNNTEAIEYATKAGLGAATAGLAGAHAYKGLPEGVRAKLASEEGSATVTPARPVTPTSAYKAIDQSQPFYLKSEHIVGEKMKGPMPAGDVQKMLLSNGVKPEEMQWTGLDDFLKENEGKKVTPQQIQEHLAGNNLQIQEVQKGDMDPNRVSYKIIPDTSNSGYSTMEVYRDGQLIRNDVDDFDKTSTPEELQNLAVLVARDKTEGATKYGSYTLPGGKNYRELLLTTPSKALPAPKIEFSQMTSYKGEPVYVGKLQNGMPVAIHHNPGFPWRVDYPHGESDGGFPTAEAAKESVQNNQRYNPAPKSPDYQTNHWGEPNVLGHIRFNDRTGPNGEKILHLEELQSDWHQKGRTHRYVDPKKPFSVPTVQEHFATRAEAEAAATANKISHNLIDDERTSDRPEGAVPDAPFKKTWPELMLKRMIKYAQDHGYDGVSWTPGEAQAERYDLSKQISRVTYAPVDGTLRAYGLNGDRVLTENATPEELANYIGKDAANKLLQTPRIDPDNMKTGDTAVVERGGEDRTVTIDPNRRAAVGSPSEAVWVTDGTHGWYVKISELAQHQLSGVDLKVGGEGMKGFYDKIIPDAANKLGKQWGAKVGEMRLGAPQSTIDALKQEADAKYEVWSKLKNDAERHTGYVYGSPESSAVDEAYDAWGEALDKYKEAKTRPEYKVPYLPLHPQMRAGIKSVPYSLFGVAGAALTLAQVKKQADELKAQFQKAGLSR